MTTHHKSSKKKNPRFDTKGHDLAAIHAMAQAMSPTKAVSMTDALGLFQQIQSLIALLPMLKPLFDLILKAFGGGGGTVTPPPIPPIIVPPPVIVPPVVTPPVPPTPGESGPGLIKELRGTPNNGLWFLKEWTGGKPGTGAVSDKDRFDSVLAGSGIGRGGDAHFDYSPYDVNSEEIGPGDPRHSLINNGLHYLEYQGKVDGIEGPWVFEDAMFGALELHGWDHDFGCTPNVKSPGSNVGNCTFQMRARVKGGNAVSGWSPLVYFGKGVS